MLAAGAPCFWFQKNQRLICSPEYQSVITQGCRSKDALFIVYGHNNGRQLGRLGVTVSRRAAPKAVKRNRIKRVVRESFRHKENILLGLDIVVIARGITQGTETKQLFISLEGHWRKVAQQCRSKS